MKRFLFPSNYKPEIDFLSTIKYMEVYKNQLIKFLQTKFDAISISVPVASSISDSYNLCNHGQRRINFDNKYSHEAFQINSVNDNYFRFLLNDLTKENIKSIISFYCQNKRDSLLTNLDSFCSQVVHVEYNTLLEEHNVEKFKNWFIIFWKEILSINNSDEVKNIFLAKERIKNEIKFVNVKTIVDLYPLLPVQKAFQLYCAKYKLVVLTDPNLKMSSGQYFSEGLATCDNFNCTSILYIYSSIHSEPIPIIKIASRPIGQLAKDQLLQISPSIYDEGLMNKRLFDKDLIQTLGFTFYFSNLMLINMQKIHLAEVISSIWTKSFEDFIKLENIKVM